MPSAVGLAGHFAPFDSRSATCNGVFQVRWRGPLERPSQQTRPADSPTSRPVAGDAVERSAARGRQGAGDGGAVPGLPGRIRGSPGGADPAGGASGAPSGIATDGSTPLHGVRTCRSEAGPRAMRREPRRWIQRQRQPPVNPSRVRAPRDHQISPHTRSSRRVYQTAGRSVGRWRASAQCLTAIGRCPRCGARAARSGRPDRSQETVRCKQSGASTYRPGTTAAATWATASSRLRARSHTLSTPGSELGTT